MYQRRQANAEITLKKNQVKTLNEEALLELNHYCKHKDMFTQCHERLLTDPTSSCSIISPVLALVTRTVVAQPLTRKRQETEIVYRYGGLTYSSINTLVNTENKNAKLYLEINAYFE